MDDITKLYDSLTPKAKRLFRTDEHGRPFTPCWSNVPEGWSALVRQALNDLAEVAHHGTRIDQIKDKFGGLRIYTGVVSDPEEDEDSEDLAMEAFTMEQAVIDEAEDRSFGICQHCGTTRDVASETRAIRKTLCKVCSRG